MLPALYMCKFNILKPGDRHDDIKEVWTYEIKYIEDIKIKVQVLEFIRFI